MKKLLTLIILAFPFMAGYAQLPKWVIPPTNDTVFVKYDDRVIQTETDGKSILWTMDGNMLCSTEQTILPFKDGVATILKKDNNTIIGFVDPDGRFTKLSNLTIAFDNPYFEDGYLPYRDNNGGYGFYTKDGNAVFYPSSVKAYPFHHGYSTYLTFDQFEKRKDPHYAYYKAEGKISQYQMISNGEIKPVEAKNIKFLSSIGANGKGVAVIKNKFYWFIPGTEIFEPLLWGDDESEKRRHLNLFGDYDQRFMNVPTDTIVILAKYGKDQIANLVFDEELRPVIFSFGGDTLAFKEKQPEEFKYSSELSSYGSDLYGLNQRSQKLLPQQFEKVGLRYGNKAFVKKDGKWGVIEILPELAYSVKLNKGEDIPFRHQKFETQIRLDLPASISARNARIDIPETTGCLIDKTSREEKDTESGNFVTYNCTLSIPDALPDTITTITYSPVQVSYDGISLFEFPLSVKAWHLKYYNVDPIESETSISNGVATFTININAQRNIGEGDYPFEITIEADSVTVVSEKLSETRRKFLVSNLQEGVNNLNILVTEKGCPPSVFPFEIYYTKPVPRKKQKEEVIIRKKTTELKENKPRLAI